MDSNGIKYKKSENPEGPTYVISRSEVFIIKYADGSKDIINRMDMPAENERGEIINKNKFFREGKSYVSAGYGFGAYISITGSSWLFGYNFNSYGYNKRQTLTGPFYLKYEYGITESIGIGIHLAYIDYKVYLDYQNYDPATGNYFLDQETITNTSFSGLLRANWHLGNNEKADPYLGFGLGYRNSTWKYSEHSGLSIDETDFYNFPLGFDATFGIRYKCSANIDLYTEVGIAKSAIQFGVTGRF